MKELVEFRRLNHLTQDQLGDFLGIKKSFISRVENGQVALPSEKFKKLLNNDMGWDVSVLQGVSKYALECPQRPLAAFSRTIKGS